MTMKLNLDQAGKSILVVARSFRLSLLVTLIAVSVWLAGNAVEHLLRYEQIAVSQGQWWRILTANLVHSNGYHLLLNLGGLWLMDAIFLRDLNFKSRLALLLFCMLGNVLLLHWFYHLKWYVGLSGALHGYLTGCALLSWKKAPVNNGIILAGVTAKLIAESNWQINQATADLIGANVVEEAHAMGYLAAWCFWLLWLAWPLLNRFKN